MRIIKRFLFFGISIVILLLLLEIYLRYSVTYLKPDGFTFELSPDPIFTQSPIGKRLRPNTRIVTKNHPQSRRDIVMSINSMGFRGPEFSKTKFVNEYRILVAGDSITWQDGLNDEETWVRLTEKLLNATQSGKFFRVINGGVGDIGTKEEVDNLKMSASVVHPELVVLAWYLNDSRPPWGFTSELGYRGLLRRYSVLVDYMYRHLVLRKWLSEKGLIRSGWGSGVAHYQWRTDRNEFLKFADYAGLDWGAAWNNDSWQLFRDEFARLKELSQQYSFKVLILPFPVTYQLAADFVEDTPQKKLFDLSQEFQFSYTDLLPFLRSEYKEQNFFFDWCHLNELGSKKVAEYLSSYILKQLYQ